MLLAIYCCFSIFPTTPQTCMLRSTEMLEICKITAEVLMLFRTILRSGSSRTHQRSLFSEPILSPKTSFDFQVHINNIRDTPKNRYTGWYWRNIDRNDEPENFKGDDKLTPKYPGVNSGFLLQMEFASTSKNRILKNLFRPFCILCLIQNCRQCGTRYFFYRCLCASLQFIFLLFWSRVDAS